MKVKTISFTYERKWNTGQYESATVGMSAWADLDEADNVTEAMRELETMVKDEVKAQSLPLLQARKASLEEVFAGLPVAVKAGNNGH